MPSSQLESIFNTFPDGVVACDREGKIIRINSAALKLFEVASETTYRGTSYRAFLHRYIGDRQPGAISIEPWLMSLLFEGEAATWLQQDPLVLLIPPGRKIYVNMRRLAVRDAEVATIYVFRDITPRYRRLLHLQRVQQALSTLREAIAQIPEHLDFAFPEETFLLAPPVLFIAGQLVDLIGHVLDCEHVSLLALEPRAGHLHYAVGSGFTSEQEEYRRSVSGSFLLSDFLDETALASLLANQEAILAADRLREPLGFREDLGAKTLLVIPIFLEKQLAGALVVARADSPGAYSMEETEFVKAVATETTLVLECLLYSYKQTKSRIGALARQEMFHLVDEFLNLASHELNTPLTAIKGNLQLAQRRLAVLKREMAAPADRENIERVEQPLASATQGSRQLERLIKNLIDDARIQAGTLELHSERCDLVVLLREAVADLRRAAPERVVIVDSALPEQAVPIIADADRITQVIDSFLANALRYSPADRPVIVHLTIEGAAARVSVHDEGPGIPLKEQGRIWERFYFTKGAAMYHELDLNFGLGLYLCRAFVERHGGSVGVQSDPGHGATFWFTLPIDDSAQ